MAELSSSEPIDEVKGIYIEAWGAEAALIQQEYFKGKFGYGQAPVLGEDA